MGESRVTGHTGWVARVFGAPASAQLSVQLPSDTRERRSVALQCRRRFSADQRLLGVWRFPILIWTRQLMWDFQQAPMCNLNWCQ